MPSDSVMDSLNLILVVGARPNFMKIAPLIKAIGAHNNQAKNAPPRVRFTLVHTGQHYDGQMSDVFFRELGIPQPDINLGVGSGSHAAQTAGVMEGFEPVCQQVKPDWVVVVGDVNSTMACTLVAAKLGIQVAHVEAGLRSFDRTMPEEINRVVTDAIADLLLTPSADADQNLQREGVPASRIRMVGNIMIDALLHHLEAARSRMTHRHFGLEERRFAYVTLHRPSNVDGRENLAAILHELERLSHKLPVLFPVHPRTRQRILDFGLNPRLSTAFQLIEPIGYLDSLCLTERARLVLTDSGGLQEESTYFRTPCLTLRPNTERPITIEVGSNRLTTPQRLAADLDEVFAQPERLGQRPPLWDGQTAQRVLGHLISG